MTQYDPTSPNLNRYRYCNPNANRNPNRNCNPFATYQYAFPALISHIKQVLFSHPF